MAYGRLVVLMYLSISGECYSIGYLPNVKGRVNIQRRGNIISGAVTYAVDIVNKSNLLKGHNLTIIYNDTKGDTLLGAKAIVHQWSEGVIAFIGPEDSCDVEATVAASLNLPMISHKCSDAVRSNKNNYRTFFRTHPPPTRVVKSIIALLKFYGWTKFTIITDIGHPFQTIASSLEQKAISNNFTLQIKEIPGFPLECCHSDIKKAVQETYFTTRVYIFLGKNKDLYTLLRELQMRKLLESGEYIVVYIDLEIFDISASYSYFILSHEMTDEEVYSATDAAQSLLVLVATSPDRERYHDFQTHVLEFNHKEPFNFAYQYDLPKMLPLSAFSLYDAVMLYSRALAKVLEEKKDPRNGTYIIEKIIAEKQYRSISGAIMRIDKNGDVEGNYTLLSRHKTPANTTFEGFRRMQPKYMMLPVGRFHYSKQSTEPEFRLERKINWINGKPPLAEPLCGFDGNLCRAPPNKNREITAGVLAGVLLSVCVVASIIYRNWKYEQEIAGLLWRITLNEIQRASSEENLSSASKTNLSQMSMESRANNQLFTQTAFYRGIWVAVKPFHFNKKNMDLSRQTKKEMKIMRELRSDNINPFIGACIESNSIYVVTEYCSKGSIQDVLENDDLKLDKMFIASLVSDLIKGMIYLHNSELKIHGNLKSSNCLITSRWVLQVADFGLYQLRNNEKNAETTEYEHFRNLLWKAPELMKQNSACNVSQKGDIYSFGIILHEIIRRQGPYGNISLSPKEIIEKVIKKSLLKEEPFRPSVIDIECEDYIVHIMQDCWAENLEIRPDFITIRERLKRMRQGMKSNIVDNMMEMMEKYANNLEDIVNERTCLLVDEQKKTESLLHRMLPKSVATQLIKGEVVVPETFDAVTIYFSDIVGFTEMSAFSTPMEVVTFLNDLYTIFDAIIGYYDVYKVETIGDAYMVVSGLPIRNGDNHASEIACMALELLEAVKIFKIRHRPHHLLKLRIGIHTGPVVAGVVGLTMPRYCLFGDTVNTASRMESHGEALRIHISLQCKLYLEKVGGYVTERRGLVKMKGKGEVATYWLIGHNRDKQHRTLSHDLVLPQPLFVAVREAEVKKRSPKLNNAHRGSFSRTDKFLLDDTVTATSIGSTSLCLSNSCQDNRISQTTQETRFQDVEEQNDAQKPITNGIKKTNLDDSATTAPLLPPPYVNNDCHRNGKSRFRFPRKKCSLDDVQQNKSKLITWFDRLFQSRLEYDRRRSSSSKLSFHSETVV